MRPAFVQNCFHSTDMIFYTPEFTQAGTVHVNNYLLSNSFD